MSWIPTTPNTPARAQADASAHLAADKAARSHALADAPAIFRASARLPSSTGLRGRGRGELLISEDTLCFEPSSLTRRLTDIKEFAHAAPSITLTEVKLAPPWARGRLVLENHGSLLHVGIAGWSIHKLRDALRATGLEVREER